MDFDPRSTDARALDFHWRASGLLAERAGLSELGRHSYRRARNSVLASLVLAGDSDRPWVSYSRSSDFYAAEGRYEGSDYNLNNLKLAVSELGEAGLIKEMRSKPGSHLTHGFQSRMIATDRLMALAQGVDLIYAGTRCPVVMKDEDGSRVAFRETAQTRRLVAEVQDVNRYLDGIDVGISADASPDDWQHTRHHIRARKIKDGRETWTCVRPTPSPEVFRVFGRGRWDRHGRWYGWWQNLPKARRAELLIYGEICIEPDFACLHPTLLYAMRGIVLQHDPYELRGWDRSAGKLALNVVINAKSIPVGITALLKKRGEVGADGAPKWVYGPAETLRIVEAVKQANPAIAADIGSDAGVRLMSIDSGMAHAVMKRSRAAGIPVLPVHDSFIAPGSKGAAVMSIMGDVLAHTISTISPESTMGSVQSIRYTPRGGAAETAELPSSLEESPAAEPVVSPSIEGVGYTPALLETPRPEAAGGLAGGVGASLPEGEVGSATEGLGVPRPLLVAPDPEGSFRPRVQVSGPSLSPVVAVSPPSPAPVAPPEPALAPRPPFPAFLQRALDEVRADAEAAAAAAARVRDLPPPPPPVRREWAPLPKREAVPAPVPARLLATVPAPRVTPVAPDRYASLDPAAPEPERPARPMTREESSIALRAVAEKARLRMEARERERSRAFTR